MNETILVPDVLIGSTASGRIYVGVAGNEKHPAEVGVVIDKAQARIVRDRLNELLNDESK